MKLANRVERVLLCASIVISLLACEQPSDNTIESARTCVNNGTSIALTDSSPAGQSLAGTIGGQCYAMVSGLSSPQAYQIQFGSLMLASGLMSQVATIVNAKNSKTSTDGLAVMMSYMASGPSQTLTSGGQTIAALMSTVAINANDPGMLYFAGLVSMSVALGALTIGSGTSVTAALSSCAGACATQVASAFATFQAGACANVSDQQSTDPSNLCYKSKQITQIAGCSAYPNIPAATLVGCLNTYASSPH